MIDWRRWPLRSLLRAVVLSSVGERVALEPGPQVFDWVEVRRVAWQQRHLHGTSGAVEIVASDAALVLGGSVPDDQELALELRAQGLQELHDLRASDRT